MISESLNLCGTKISYITDDTMVFRSGNTLVFFSVSSRRNSVLTFPEGLSLDAFVVCPEPAAPLQQGQKVRGDHALLVYSYGLSIHSFIWTGAFVLSMSMHMRMYSYMCTSKCKRVHKACVCGRSIMPAVPRCILPSASVSATRV